MPRKKLTPKLKEQIKQNYRDLNKSEFSGEALHYLNKVKGAAKARKIKASYYVKIDRELTIDKRTGIYEFIEEGAENNNQTVKQFIAKNKEAIKELIESNYKHFKDSHLDKLEKSLDELKSSKEIYNNGVPISKVKLMSYISMLQNSAAEAGLYDYIPVEVGQDLEGNLYTNIPTTEELLQLDKEQLTEYLDENYPNIKYHKK